MLVAMSRKAYMQVSVSFGNQHLVNAVSQFNKQVAISDVVTVESLIATPVLTKESPVRKGGEPGQMFLSFF